MDASIGGSLVYVEGAGTIGIENVFSGSQRRIGYGCQMDNPFVREIGAVEVEGGLAQGLGYALTEGLVYDAKGQVRNSSFTDYKVFRAQDMPEEICTILIHTEDTQGYIGAKSIGETVMVNTAAAVANAVEDATGIRLTTLPITPEKLYKELKKRGSNNFG